MLRVTVEPVDYIYWGRRGASGSADQLSALPTDVVALSARATELVIDEAALPAFLFDSWPRADGLVSAPA